MSEATLNHILEIFYILIGLQFLYTAYRALRSQDKSKSLGTAKILDHFSYFIYRRSLHTRCN